MAVLEIYHPFSPLLSLPIYNPDMYFIMQMLFPLVQTLTVYIVYTVKFRKEAPRLIFFKGPFGGAYIRRARFSTEGNLRFKIDWASLIVKSKFTVFVLFYFAFEGNFPSTSPPGGLYLEGRFNGGFFALLVWGPYIWRGLFSEFYAISHKRHRILTKLHTKLGFKDHIAWRMLNPQASIG